MISRPASACARSRTCSPTTASCEHKLPIPEGLTSEQIVDRLRDNDLLTGDIKETPREGSLLPDTYVFERGDSRNALLAHMAAAQTKMVDEIWQKRSPDLPIKSPGELVTLASIVEKETGKADERPRVAGVFVNRLQKHMKLQSDPTIVYGLAFGKGTLGHSITKAELQEATPYNTYFIDGLPPGPICNPGRAAMEAVANPARTRDLYFVADGTGGHAFAETLDQHQKNVAHCARSRRTPRRRLTPDAPPANIRGEAPELEMTRYAQRFGAPPPDAARSARSASRPTPRRRRPPRRSPSRLAKVADSRRKLAALVGTGGSLSAAEIGGGGIDQYVVTGVNDPAPGASDDAFGYVDSGPVGRGAAVARRARRSQGALGALRRRQGRRRQPRPGARAGRRRSRRHRAGRRPSARLRRVRRHEARPAAQPDLRSQFRKDRCRPASSSARGRRAPARWRRRWRR